MEDTKKSRESHIKILFHAFFLWWLQVLVSSRTGNECKLGLKSHIILGEINKLINNKRCVVETTLIFDFISYMLFKMPRFEIQLSSLSKFWKMLFYQQNFTKWSSVMRQTPVCGASPQYYHQDVITSRKNYKSSIIMK